MCRISAIAGLAGLLIASFFSGCSLLDREEELPVYVTLRAPGVRLRDNNAFISYLGVRDAWIDQGDGSLGIYTMPVTIPVYPSNGSEIVLSGGILNSGLGINRNKYPFWVPQIHSLAGIAPLDTLVIDPVFEYMDQDSVLSIPLDEDFEAGSLPLFESLDGEDPEVARLQTVTQGAYQGRACGMVKLTSLTPKFEIESTRSFSVPRTATNDTYIEVTFRGDLPFIIGAKTSSAELTDNILFYGDEWKTVYIHIGEFVRQAQTNDNVVVFMRGSGTAGQTVWLDNIRLVQFK